MSETISKNLGDQFVNNIYTSFMGGKCEGLVGQSIFGINAISVFMVKVA